MGWESGCVTYCETSHVSIDLSGSAIGAFGSIVKAAERAGFRGADDEGFIPCIDDARVNLGKRRSIDRECVVGIYGNDGQEE